MRRTHRDAASVEWLAVLLAEPRSQDQRDALQVLTRPPFGFGDHLYVVKAQDGLYKVGYTAQLLDRFGRYFKDGALAIAFVVGDRELERTVHASLSEFEVRPEWFALPDAVGLIEDWGFSRLQDG